MSDVTGHVRKRSRKQANPWQVVLEMGEDPSTGRRRRKVHSGYASEKEAKKALRGFLSDLEAEAYVPPAKLTVRDYLVETWLPAHRREVRANTAKQYEVLLSAYVLPHLGGVKLQDLTTPDVSRLYGLLEKRGGKGGAPLAPKTVRNVHLLLHRALEDAVAWGLRKTNPAKGAKPPTAKRSRRPASAMVTWNETEVRAFLASVEGDRLEVLWRLLFLTGMRRSELLGLSWSSVDLGKGTVAVVRTLVEVGAEPRFGEPKTEHSRRVLQVDSRTVEALKAHRRRQLEERMAWGEGYQDHGLVFAREDGSPLRPAWASRRFEALQDGLGLPRLGMHGARHSWATNALRAGVPLKVVSAHLGHSSIAVTGDVYQHVTDQLGADAAERMAALYG